MFLNLHASSPVKIHIKIQKYMSHFISIRAGDNIAFECGSHSWIISLLYSLNVVLGIEHQWLPWDVGALTASEYSSTHLGLGKHTSLSLSPRVVDVEDLGR